ncbi:MAG: ATP-binding cassette domain-containing protein, partial [Clostridia bacterium]|nr:ATP-binding cassette domain-containing protein [Clostridia bacterium]
MIAFVVALFSLFFAALASSFFTDLFVSSGETYVFKASYAITITVAALALFLWIIIGVKPYILGAVFKRKDNKEEEQEDEVLLEVKNLCQYFPVETNFFGEPVKFLKAVDDVSFKLKKGKTLGIVGESGCGKTTMGRSLLHLYDITSGEVYYKGEKISDLKNGEFDKLRPSLQMIFQDPYASLSPRLTVGEIIGEAARQHGIVSKAEYHDYVLKVMKMCGLQPHYFERYPHEFSGGQRQRICIARALALKPEVVVCDEPVSALDVSIQAQIINMLIELRKTLGLTYVFISHDLSVVKHISDEVGVMYLGSLVEYGSKDAIFNNTLHPYTKALFSAVPVPNPHVKMNRVILKGDIPSPVNPPSGCKFHTRCESCMDICTRIKPIYKEVEKGHFCACHLYDTEEEVKKMEDDYAEEQKLIQLQNEDNVNF